MMEPQGKIWMDGSFVNWADAHVHVLTHSLHYGLAAFEGIRCYKGKSGSAIFKLQEHVDRLFESAHIVMMTIPYDKKQVTEAIVETVRINKLDACYIRPLLYIGYGAMGVYPGDNPIKLAIAAWKWGSYPRRRRAGQWHEGPRVLVYAPPCQRVDDERENFRVLCELDSGQAGSEGHGYDEAILLDPEGYVSEGTGENIFIVRKGRIKTIPLTSILEGITRNAVIDLRENRA